MSVAPDPHTASGGADTRVSCAPARVDAAAIDAVLRAALAPVALEVEDDGHRHVGHAGAREGGHFTVRITASAFDGLSRIARHRLVYDALAALMPRGIHALAIVARAPADR